MMAGKLDRRVGIYRAGPAGDDGFTETPGTMALLTTRAAHVAHMSGKEAIEATGKDGTLSSRFVMRWDSVTASLTELDELQHDGTRYAIVSPPVEIGRRDCVEIIAQTIGAV